MDGHSHQALMVCLHAYVLSFLFSLFRSQLLALLSSDILVSPDMLSESRERGRERERAKKEKFRMDDQSIDPRVCLSVCLSVSEHSQKSS